MMHDIIDKALKDKLAEVRRQGRDEALMEVAKVMSDKGCDIDLISQVTGLSTADIKNILD